MLAKPRNLFYELPLRAVVRYLLVRRFAAVRLSGYEGFREELKASAAGATIFFGNHQSWWDGFFDVVLARDHGMSPWLMMEEANLRRYFWFQHTGVFGVETQSARGRAASLLHAVRLLEEKPGRCLIIYPHGRLVPDYEAWPFFQPGVEKLLDRVEGLRAFPVYRRITFGRHARPEAWLEIAPPLKAGATLAEAEAALREAGEVQGKKLREDADWYHLRGGRHFLQG